MTTDEQDFLDTDLLLQEAKTSSPDRFDRITKRAVERAKHDYGLGQAIEDRRKSKLTMRINRNGMGYLASLELEFARSAPKHREL